MFASCFDVAFWLCNIDFFINHTVEKCSFYVKLVKFQVSFSCYGDDYSERVIANNWCKRFLIVDSLNLAISLGEKPGLPPVGSTSLVYF